MAREILQAACLSFPVIRFGASKDIPAGVEVLTTPDPSGRARQKFGMSGLWPCNPGGIKGRTKEDRAQARPGCSCAAKAHA